MSKQISEMYAFVVEDPTDDGNEAIPAFKGPDGWMPMVGVDKERIEMVRVLAKTMADTQNVKLRLVRFSQVEEIDRIIPEKQQS